MPTLSVWPATSTMVWLYSRQRAGDVVQHRHELRLQVAAVEGEGDVARHVQGDVVALADHVDAGTGHARAQRGFLAVLVGADRATGEAADAGADQRALATFGGIIASEQARGHADRGTDQCATAACGSDRSGRWSGRCTWRSRLAVSAQARRRSDNDGVIMRACFISDAWHRGLRRATMPALNTGAKLSTQRVRRRVIGARVALFRNRVSAHQALRPRPTSSRASQSPISARYNSLSNSGPKRWITASGSGISFASAIRPKCTRPL